MRLIFLLYLSGRPSRPIINGQALHQDVIITAEED